MEEIKLRPSNSEFEAKCVIIVVRTGMYYTDCNKSVTSGSSLVLGYYISASCWQEWQWGGGGYAASLELCGRGRVEVAMFKTNARWGGLWV